jgi:hypothetical protein
MIGAIIARQAVKSGFDALNERTLVFPAEP